MSVAAGAYFIAETVAAGGIALDPIGGGATAVCATAPGLRAASPLTVDRHPAAISIFSTAGAGGRRADGRSLYDPPGRDAHGGVTVRVTSSDPSAPAALA